MLRRMNSYINLTVSNNGIKKIIDQLRIAKEGLK